MRPPASPLVALFLAVLVLTLGCGSPDEPTPTAAPDAPWREALHASAELGGRALVATSSDGWTVRRVDRPAHGERDRRLARGTGGFADGDEPMADAAVLEAAVPGAPVPAAAAERGRGPAEGGAPLRAGSIDDNAAYEDFLTFLAAWEDQAGVADRAHVVDVRDRTWIRVLGPEGRPVPLARVTVIDEQADRVAWSATTLGDGRVAFYPHADGLEVPASWRVEVLARGQTTVAALDAQARTLDVRVPTGYAMPTSVPLDVCFLIDTTGSMGDEIGRIKHTLLAVTKRLRDLAVEFDLRYGAVLYRDLSDDYVTMRRLFSSDIEGFDAALRAVEANGGGDTPESLNQGLAEAIGQMDWRADAAKLCFLVADAPPHMDYAGDVSYDRSMRAAAERGIKVHAVAASGLDPFGSLVMRQVAQMTRGRFTFIEYGGDVAASGAAHGVKDTGPANNLDAILFRTIQDELSGWGRMEASSSVD